MSAEIMIVNFLIKQNHNRASSGPTWLIVIKPSKYEWDIKKISRLATTAFLGD